MKHGKKPTVAQSNALAELGLDPKEWLIVKWQNDQIVIQNRDGKTVKAINR